MKKIIFLLAVLFCSQLSAQEKEVVYGTVRIDGYQKITKGAFWATRPEAKMVYNNQYLDGVEVKTLESDYFVRFIDSEHNNFDGNYIIFPKGERIYKKNGNWYAAICGNQIDYFQSVNNIIIQGNNESNLNLNLVNSEPKGFLDPDSKAFSFPKDLGTASREFKSSEQSNLVEIPKTKKVVNLRKVVIIGVPVGLGMGALLYALLSKKGDNETPSAPFVPVDPTGP